MKKTVIMCLLGVFIFCFMFCGCGNGDEGSKGDLNSCNCIKLDNTAYSNDAWKKAIELYEARGLEPVEIPGESAQKVDIYVGKVSNYQVPIVSEVRGKWPEMESYLDWCVETDYNKASGMLTIHVGWEEDSVFSFIVTTDGDEGLTFYYFRVKYADCTD